MKKIYVIRHCKAEGQLPNAQLTEEGREQAKKLAEFFSGQDIDRIISSPFQRAIQSIEPLSKALHIEIELDQQLTEKVLSNKDMSDWLLKLRDTFTDMTLRFDGGESSQEAMNRIAGVVNRLFDDDKSNAVIVTHGNLLALLLKYYNDEFGFEDWKKLSNPDVFQLTKQANSVTYERLWIE
ncbi:2,3-bisphosphoglycerate-dependent phosphoglycerate mutase [Oceanobacillus limi]|uniref:2,3-bisphosphoglycerate-dependent phosphoglycerate mutase n=1 Tax=Oceanobacillus limi TaxID=930131 RepID=A0A1H9ZBV3_9BACI|nr:histidine phosphatase family protein [Oceanobacillus limi]SES78808.1 2,3-bisphosphoglycerate-dependent phosphoglycerate mutase [Oceanobacillus limi]